MGDNKRYGLMVESTDMKHDCYNVMSDGSTTEGSVLQNLNLQGCFERLNFDVVALKQWRIPLNVLS